MNLNCVKARCSVGAIGQFVNESAYSNVVQEVAVGGGIELNPSPDAGSFFFLENNVSAKVF